MVDVVAKALCNMAGRSANDACEEGEHRKRDSLECSCCERLPNGRVICRYWESFRLEAQAAIVAAHKWHRENRRWPSFLTQRN